MLAVQVRLLSGRYVATQFDDRDRAEWPPHPARLFAAAVAAWADVEEPDPRERAALNWWESLGAPSIACSPPEQTASRSAVTHYVPVNDATVLSRDASGAYGELSDAIEAQAAAVANPHKTAASRAQRRADSAVQKAQRKAADYSRGGRVPDSGLLLFPENRIRQARTFPSTTPADEIVIFTWPDAAADPGQVAALDAVLGRIGRLGHSSTPVDVAIVPEAPSTPVFEPGEPAELSLRTATAGQFNALVAAHEQHQGSDLRTLPAASTGYRRHRARPVMTSSNFDDRRWILFDLSPRRALTDSLLLTRALRDALMVHAEQPPAPILSGHLPTLDGEPTAPAIEAHAAYVALPYVGSRYADGAIHALAVVLPGNASEKDRAEVVRAAARWHRQSGRLVLGSNGEFVASRLDPEDASVTARPSSWARAASRWSSALPVALDRHPGSLDSLDPRKRDRAYAEAEGSVVQACRNVGLPAPSSVSIRFDAPIRGTRPARAFRPFTVGSRRLRRMLVHVDLTFSEEVRGPVILGAGRFFGYGLCWPHSEASR